MAGMCQTGEIKTLCWNSSEKVLAASCLMCAWARTCTCAHTSSCPAPWWLGGWDASGAGSKWPTAIPPFRERGICSTTGRNPPSKIPKSSSRQILVSTAVLGLFGGCEGRSWEVLAVAGREEQALDPVCRCNRCCVFPDWYLNPFPLIKSSLFALFLTCLHAAGVKACRTSAFSFHRPQEVGSSC